MAPDLHGVTQPLPFASWHQPAAALAAQADAQAGAESEAETEALSAALDDEEEGRHRRMRRRLRRRVRRRLCRAQADASLNAALDAEEEVAAREERDRHEWHLQIRMAPARLRGGTEWMWAEERKRAQRAREAGV